MRAIGESSTFLDEIVHPRHELRVRQVDVAGPTSERSFHTAAPAALSPCGPYLRCGAPAHKAKSADATPLILRRVVQRTLRRYCGTHERCVGIALFGIIGSLFWTPESATFD